jgi:general secretion pathway protein G
MRFASKCGRTKLRACNSHIRRSGSHDFGERGFTLIEMVVVISLVLVLLAIALPMYNQSILRSREATLRQNLTTLNKAVEEFSLDKKRAPQSLDELVPHYIKFIPNDITGSNTWQADNEDSEDAWDPNQTGIKSVHSGSNETSTEGTPYSSWTH